jgi:predicted dehydrogenase
MSDKLRVGVVGTRWGHAHITAYQKLPEQFEVVAVCDIDEDRARAAAKEVNAPRVFTDFTSMCALNELDVISIATPSYLHTPQAKEALEAGKHVVVEKPIAGSLKQIDDLIAVDARTPGRVMPIFQYRFGHGVQKLKFLQEQGITGRAFLSTVETAWRRRADYYAVGWRAKWETDLGGALVRLGIHAHDIVYFMLGAPRSVTAHIATLVNPVETEDTVTASLEMADGSLCSLSVTTGSAKEVSRHRFCFSELTAESNSAPYTNTSDPWQFTGDSPQIDVRITEALSHFEPLPEGLVGQFLRFYRAIVHDAELPVTLHDARASLELVTAIYHAADSRQAVQLPLGKDHPKYAGWHPARQRQHGE